jgi:hypothetical protein
VALALNAFGGMAAKFSSFLIVALVEGKWPRLRPAHFFLVERSSGTHRTAVWLDQGLVRVSWCTESPLAPAGRQTTIPHTPKTVTIPTALFWHITHYSAHSNKLYLQTFSGSLYVFCEIVTSERAPMTIMHKSVSVEKLFVLIFENILELL